MWNPFSRKKRDEGPDAVAENMFTARQMIAEARKTGTIQRVSPKTMTKLLNDANADLVDETVQFMLESGGCTVVGGRVYQVVRE